ncbi:MAG: hypothetical protein NTY36_07980 [Deltaproteobacteria bacterium]|nr:hypothetical protein [Deltaproteobacteria bacterium]
MSILLAGTFMLGLFLGVLIICLLTSGNENEETKELLGVDRKLPLDAYSYPDSYPDTLPWGSERN